MQPRRAPRVRAADELHGAGDRDANACRLVLYGLGWRAGRGAGRRPATARAASDAARNVVVALDGDVRRRPVRASSTTRAATAAAPSSSPRTGGWRWRAATAGPGRLTLTGMLSLDALTATPQGYRLIFQAGEAYHGQAIVDRQHPHDFLMQAAAIWRVPVNDSTGVTIAGAPVGEPALGPVAFMHRPSAAENPAAPLAHHTLDSTHIAMGVITAQRRSRAVDHRVVDLQRTGAGRQPVGHHGSRSARFVVRARLVQAVSRMAVPGVPRIPDAA